MKIFMAGAHKKVNLTSSDISASQLEQLRRILPEVFREDRIDWDELRAVLGDAVDPRIEKFNFTWAGKGEAIKSVLLPSKATLRPAKDESLKFDETENVFIEGDNLEVLKLLQKAYFEKVKMIYIDPPYNTGGDFVYKDNFAAPINNYLKLTGQKDGNGTNLTTNKETNGRFHSDWLSMMYPRLKLAWSLLREDGVIFISIDDHEVHHLRMMMDEIFGEENLLGVLVWKKRHGHGKQTTTNNFSVQHEYILAYQKSGGFIFKGELRNRGSFTNPDNDSRGDWAKYPIDIGSTKDERPNCYYDLVDPKTGHIYHANPNRVWAYHKPTMQTLVEEGRIVFDPNGKNRPYLKRFWKELDSDRKQLSSWIANVNEVVESDGEVITISSDYNTVATKSLNELFDGKLFDYPKPVSLIRNLIEQADVSDGEIVLDFFAGSATTAQAVFEYNLESKKDVQFILVQLPEKIKEDTEAYTRGYATITEIGKDRIRKVIEKYETRGNLGFKVFKLGESNYPENQFEFDPDKSEDENQEAYEKYLARAEQGSLLKEVNETDIIYENIVKEGYSLNANVLKGPYNIYTVMDGPRQFSICLDYQLGESTLKALMGLPKGTTFICFDNALDDSAKANLALHLELKTI